MEVCLIFIYYKRKKKTLQECEENMRKEIYETMGVYPEMFGDAQQSIKLSMFGEEHICQYCGCLTVQSDDLCYANPKNNVIVGVESTIEEKESK
jgi:hypothetical protein